ncbi:DUF6439 family protein [Synechococcus elongatus]|uniref:DUF6439 family protein n=1 Tax=Synechococcus elongatus TaxID=32046 RepID=UPI000F7F2C89|nr:DUF6439 family protein [Synechococcus elongatus]
MTASPLQSPASQALREVDTIAIAQVLLERLALTDDQWHRYKNNRPVRAREQTAAAVLALLQDRPDDAQAHLQQALGLLDRSITPPPCPTHRR